MDRTFSKEILLGLIVALGLGLLPGLVAFFILKETRGTPIHVPLWMAATIVSLLWIYSTVASLFPRLRNGGRFFVTYPNHLEAAITATVIPLIVAVVWQRPTPFRLTLRDMFILTGLMALASIYIYARSDIYPWLHG